MNERYVRLYKLPENLYIDDAPIIIAAGALLKDNRNGKVLVHLKLQNLNSLQLIACKVSIRAFDPSGAELPGIEGYSYLDLMISYGETFGSDDPIYLPDNTTRNISVAIIQAVYKGGEIWQHSVEEWSPVFQYRQRIEDQFSDIELQKQYAFEVGGNCKYIPTVDDKLFLCTCGAINLLKSETCFKCKRDFSSLIFALEPIKLKEKKDARLAKEESHRLEQERKLAEERKSLAAEAERQQIATMVAKKRARYIANILGAATIIGITIVIVAKQVIIPLNTYRAAKELLANRDYNGAIELFTELGEYKDSPELIMNVPYVRAADMLSDGDYERAIKAFQDLGDYSDSPERLAEAKECLYQEALLLIDSGAYIKAFSIFQKSISDYKDSAQLATSMLNTVYSDAILSYNNKQYSTAYEEFTAIRNDHPLFIDDRIKDYIICCDVRRIDFDDGKYHELGSVYEQITKIKNSSLKEELMDIPQMKMVFKLEGVWTDGNYETLNIVNGSVQSVFGNNSSNFGISFNYGISYCERNYYFYSNQYYNKYIDEPSYKLTNISDTSFNAISLTGLSINQELESQVYTYTKKID